MPSQSQRLLTLIALTALLGLFFLTRPENRPEASGPYTFAALLSESGRYSFVGRPGGDVLRAFQNSKVRFRVYDTQGDPKLTLAALQELARDRSVLGVVGPATTDETLAVIAQADRWKLPCLSISAADRSQPKSPWVFRLPVTSYHMVYQIGDQLARQNLKRIALISVDSGFGRGGRRELGLQGPDFGLEMVANVTAPDRKLTIEEAEGLIRSALAARPQALVIWWSAVGAADLTLAARRLGVAVPIYHSGGIASPDFLKATGPASDGVLFPGSPLLVPEFLPLDHPQRRPIGEFREFVAGHPGLTLSTFAGYGWDAARLFQEAVTQVGPDREKIRAYLENLQNRAATAGVFHFSPQDHNGLTHDSFLMLRIENGHWRPVGDQQPVR